MHEKVQISTCTIMVRQLPYDQHKFLVSTGMSAYSKVKMKSLEANLQRTAPTFTMISRASSCETALKPPAWMPEFHDGHLG